MPKPQLIVALLAPAAIAAQDLPAYVPINPVLASRSAIYFQPIVSPADGWRTAITIDYSNAIERTVEPGLRQYLFDAELMQVDFWLRRDLSKDWFVIGNVAVRSAHDGFLDSFLNWYHDVIGLPVPARNARPIDTYGWRFALPTGAHDIPRESAFLGDARVGIGHRIGPVQVVATATLPTGTNKNPEWSRNTVGTALTVSATAFSTSRVGIELGGSIGYTPTHGELADYQRSVFAAGTAGLKWRFWGQQVVFGSLLVQSANWKDSGFSTMDEPEVTLDFGGLLQLRRGWPRLQVGMTEDLLPRGPSIDAGFRLGLHW